MKLSGTAVAPPAQMLEDRFLTARGGGAQAADRAAPDLDASETDPSRSGPDHRYLETNRILVDIDPHERAYVKAARVDFVQR